MKHFFLIAAFAAATMPVTAQLQKGAWMVGGTGSFSGGFGSGGGVYGQIGLQPRAGYFLTNRLVLGSGIGVGLASSGRDGEGALVSYTGSFMPFGRYYLGKQPATGEVPARPVPFVEIGGGLSAARFRGNIYNNRSGYGAVGLNGFLNQHVAWEVNLSYQRNTNNSGFGPSYQGGFSGGAGFQIFLGRGAKNPAPAGSVEPPQK